jgi:hypothetical protein
MICILSEVVQHSLLIPSKHCSTQPEEKIQIYSRLPGNENAMYSRKVQTAGPFIYHDDGSVGRISWKVAKTSAAQHGATFLKSAIIVAP